MKKCDNEKLKEEMEKLNVLLDKVYLNQEEQSELEKLLDLIFEKTPCISFSFSIDLSNPKPKKISQNH